MACDLNCSEDQRQILDAAAAMLQASYPVARLRDHGHDDLSAVAAFGALGLALPEEIGGAGFTLVEEALVHVLFGRHLVSTRVLAAAIAVRLAGLADRLDIAQKAASGDLGVCAALPAGDNSFLLIDEEGADLALIFGSRRLALIDLGGRPKERATGFGHSVPLTRAPSASVATIGASDGGRLLDITDLLVSAQLLGIAEASRDLAVSYAKVREQFGKPIGAFQAIKHQCANMAIEAEMLSSLADMAAIALRDGREDASFQLAALRTLAARTALANARACIQIHGGIGFSAEADAHHYLKQAHVLRHLGCGANMLDLPAPLTPYRAPHTSI